MGDSGSTLRPDEDLAVTVARLHERQRGTDRAIDRIESNLSSVLRAAEEARDAAREGSAQIGEFGRRLARVEAERDHTPVHGIPVPTEPAKEDRAVLRLTAKQIATIAAGVLGAGGLGALLGALGGGCS